MIDVAIMLEAIVITTGLDPTIETKPRIGRAPAFFDDLDPGSKRAD